MKKTMRILALILSVLMLATAFAACGGKKDSDKSGASSEAVTGAATEAETEAPTGSVQTKDQITVYVPADMELDTESSDAQSSNSAKLVSKEDPNNFILIMILGSEETANEIMENNRAANEDNFPSDVLFERSGVTWSGFSIDLSATRVIYMYAIVNDKVYYITSAGYGKNFNIVDDDSELFDVIDSLE